MFDISALKEMKLPELQEIAKLAKTIKFNGVKKDALIAQILEHQDKTYSSTEAIPEEITEKPKRTRIVASKKESLSDVVVEKEIPILTTEDKETNPIQDKEQEKKTAKAVKFSKSEYEQKIASKKAKIVPAESMV